MYWPGCVDSRMPRARDDRADRRELLGALAHLVVELRQVGMARVGRERRRHAVHADVVALEP